MDYRGAASAADDAATTGDRYLAVRAHLILGDYDRAAALLDQWATAFCDDPFLLSFLRLQLRMYRRERLADLVSEFCRLREIPTSDYFVGEYHLVIGYLHHLLDEFKQGSRHHR